MPAAILRTLCALIFAATLTTAPASAAPPDDIMTITFVRHAESEGNADGIMETAVPGSSLTHNGKVQAAAIAARLSRTEPDGIYSSNLDRAQQTAKYLADQLKENRKRAVGRRGGESLRPSVPVVVLPGLQEIEAGEFEGQPADLAGPPMYAVIDEWLKGNLTARIPGSVDGNDVVNRFNEAVLTIYASGDRKPVVFSHGGAIAVWTLKTVSNTQVDLIKSQPLYNTAYVVVQGNPTVGWRLLDWNGTKIA